MLNLVWYFSEQQNHIFVIQTREIFSFLSLVNDSVTMGLIFLLLSISAIISSNTNNIFCLAVCPCHVTYAFQSESTLYSCLNVKELLAQSRHEIWRWSDCNWKRTQNHLVLKRVLSFRWVMHLLLQIQNIQLLILFVDAQKCLAIINYVLLCLLF